MCSESIIKKNQGKNQRRWHQHEKNITRRLREKVNENFPNNLQNREQERIFERIEWVVGKKLSHQYKHKKELCNATSGIFLSLFHLRFFRLYIRKHEHGVVEWVREKLFFYVCVGGRILFMYHFVVIYKAYEILLISRWVHDQFLCTSVRITLFFCHCTLIHRATTKRSQNLFFAIINSTNACEMFIFIFCFCSRQYVCARVNFINNSVWISFILLKATHTFFSTYCCLFCV